jgi:hypothetical protein
MRSLKNFNAPNFEQKKNGLSTNQAAAISSLKN